MQGQGLRYTPDIGMVDDDLNTLLIRELCFQANEGVCREVVQVDLVQVDLGNVGELGVGPLEGPRRNHQMAARLLYRYVDSTERYKLQGD